MAKRMKATMTGAAIRRFMKEREESQSRTALSCGVNVRSLRKYLERKPKDEKTPVPAPVEIILKLRQNFRLSVDDVLKIVEEVHI
jgi:uncharacterized protein YehS (DUF1456 family)